jgi:hypothetical protein
MIRLKTLFEKSVWFAIVAVSVLGLLLWVLVQVYPASPQDHGPLVLFRIYPGLIVAMVSGFFGATFSMLVQSSRRATEGTLEDLSGASAWHMLFVRGSVGLGAAAILYFFFRSGLLDGSLWPKLHELQYDALKGNVQGLVPNKDWCLLVIWSFLAGFSETLVPNILSKTEQKASVS